MRTKRHESHDRHDHRFVAKEIEFDSKSIVGLALCIH